MNGRKVEELQRAIGSLTQEELEELRLWLDEYAGPVPLDRRIETDLSTGRLDKAVQTALHDEKRGRVRPLIDECNIAPRKASGEPIKLSRLRFKVALTSSSFS